MGYRALTISRQYGSGGARIAKLIAERTGWTLLDAALIDAVAREAGVDFGTAQVNDERVDSWFHQFNKGGLRAVAAAGGMLLADTDLFDATAMAALSRGIIERAYTHGNAVIVGRGAQCILAGRPDVFRVFIYASETSRLHRIQTRLRPGTDAQSLVHSVDEVRARYIRRFYRRDWNDLDLYNLMISSDAGDEETAATINYALGIRAT